MKMLFRRLSSGEGVPWTLLSMEALLIVVSVLLALGINSWRESRGQQQLAERAMHNIIDEVRQNCRAIESAIDYHRAVARGDVDPEGMRIGLLRNDAWASAQAAGAAYHLDYEVAVVIGAIHADQHDHRTQFQGYMHALFNHAMSLDAPMAGHPPAERNIVPDLLAVQERLLDRYQELFALAETHFPAAVEFGDGCARAGT